MAFRKLTLAFKVEAFNRVKRWGDISKVAQKTGYSQSFVTKTLQGLQNNDKIVNTAYRMVKSRLRTKMQATA